MNRTRGLRSPRELGSALAVIGATVMDWRAMAETGAEAVLAAVEEMIFKEERIQPRSALGHPGDAARGPGDAVFPY